MEWNFFLAPGRKSLYAFKNDPREKKKPEDNTDVEH